MKKRIYIYCEGQTEEGFINNILYEYLRNKGIYVYPIICATKCVEGRKYKGGISDYQKMKRELISICKEHSNEYVTTMFDYYGMPNNTPGIDVNNIDIYSRIEQIEYMINEDIGLWNCKFHLMLHEFEAILFSNPDSFDIIAKNKEVDEIKRIRDNYKNPEYINNSPETAPSKRLKRIFPNYSKIKDGVLVSQNIGIDKIIEECPHFKKWIDNIINDFRG